MDTISGFPKKSYENSVQEKDPRNHENGVHGARVTIRYEIQMPGIRFVNGSGTMHREQSPFVEFATDRVIVKKEPEEVYRSENFSTTRTLSPRTVMGMGTTLS